MLQMFYNAPLKDTHRETETEHVNCVNVPFNGVFTCLCFHAFMFKIVETLSTAGNYCFFPYLKFNEVV